MSSRVGPLCRNGSVGLAAVAVVVVACTVLMPIGALAQQGRQRERPIAAMTHTAQAPVPRGTPCAATHAAAAALAGAPKHAVCSAATGKCDAADVRRCAGKPSCSRIACDRAARPHPPATRRPHRRSLPRPAHHPSRPHSLRRMRPGRRCCRAISRRWACSCRPTSSSRR